jgi:hypothetical protein
VTKGWEKSGLHTFDENRWKEEKWAEQSVPFALPCKPPGQPNARRSKRTQLTELSRVLLNDTLTVEQKLEHVRQCARANPSDHEIIQAAMPRPHAQPGPRRHGRLENSVMTWMTSDDAKQRAREKEAKLAEEQQTALRRAGDRESVAKMKQLHRTAEEAYERAMTSDGPDSPESSSPMDELQTTKRIALEAFRVYEARGVGKTCATKAKKLINLADKRIRALDARGRCAPLIAAALVNPSANRPAVDVSDENQDPLAPRGAENADGPCGSPSAAGHAASMSVEQSQPLARIRALAWSVWHV